MSNSPHGPATPAKPRRRASALFTVLVALAVFAIFTGAVAIMVVERLRGAKRSVLQQRANYACEAGFVLATEWLEQQINYNDAANSLTFSAINPATFNASHTNITLPNDPETKVTVRITSNLLPPAGGGPATAIIGPNGMTIQPGQVYVQTVACVGGDLAPASSRHLGGLASLGTQNFPYAIQCEGPINMTNSNVTTYTSYDLNNPGTPLAEYWEYHDIALKFKFPNPIPKPVLVHKPGCHAIATDGGHNGSMPGIFANEARLLSNARVKAITLTNSRVDGQLFCGAGSSPATAISATPAQSWVAQPPAASSFPLFITKYKPPVEPATVTAVYNGGSLSVSPGTYYRDCTINGGDLILNCSGPGANEFYFSNSLNLNGSRVVVANAGLNTRAKVYVGKTLNIVGGSVNKQFRKGPPGAGPGSFKNPAEVGEVERWSFNLEFLGVGSGGIATNPTGQTQVNIRNASVWALFAGSSMNFNMNGGELGGAIKCNSVNMINSNMYYDVGVNVNNIASSLWGRVSWTMTGVTDYGDSLYILAQGGLPGGAAGIAPQGAAAMCVGQVGAGTSANLGANGGAAIAVPGPATVGTGGAAAGASCAVASSNASFWAALFLGQ